jgi:phosphoribosylformylglycinamidine cyclo-ligase
MTSDDLRAVRAAYRGAGVDTDEAARGLDRLVARITSSWPRPGDFGAVQLPIGYFANVIDIGGTGLAICTDGVGSKAIIAQAMNRYDTIGIDCVAVNVNDLICVGARPLSLVDYIAVEHVDAQVLEAIGAGLAAGAEEAGISISGGETAQLKTSGAVSTWRAPQSAPCRSTGSSAAVTWSRATPSSASRAAAFTATG